MAMAILVAARWEGELAGDALRASAGWLTPTAGCAAGAGVPDPVDDAVRAAD